MLLKGKMVFVAENPLKSVCVCRGRQSLLVLKETKYSNRGALWSCSRLVFCEVQPFPRI